MVGCLNQKYRVIGVGNGGDEEDGWLGWLYREKVMMVFVTSMKNSRSVLCKAAIMAGVDLFNRMMVQLLLKHSQDKKFVCEEAERTFKTMVVSTASIPLLQNVKVTFNEPESAKKACENPAPMIN
ncbi:TOG array regulator of axonemal microtubules protein 1, partial [Tanacetum coccineum]